MSTSKNVRQPIAPHAEINVYVGIYVTLKSLDIVDFDLELQCVVGGLRTARLSPLSNAPLIL